MVSVMGPSSSLWKASFFACRRMAQAMKSGTKFSQMEQSARPMTRIPMALMISLRCAGGTAVRVPIRVRTPDTSMGTERMATSTAAGRQKRRVRRKARLARRRAGISVSGVQA